MRLLTLLLLTFLCTCVRAQKSRIDTVPGPIDGYTTYRFITEGEAKKEMTKGEMFMRGLKPGDPLERGGDYLDSLVIVDPAGVVVDIQDFPRPKNTARGTTPKTPYSDQTVVILEGRIGKSFVHQVKIKNPRDEEIVLRRTDNEQALKTSRQAVPLPAKGATELNVQISLPRGSETRPLLLTDDEYSLEVRFVLVGHDLSEKDFVASKTEAAADPWEVPAGRETLYLRLRSTEKLMTIYKGGKVYNNVAVGHQLDELSLSGLGYGDYLLEVVDLATGKKRYHGLRRS